MDNLLARTTRRRFSTAELTDGTVVRLRSLIRSEQRQWKELTKDKAAEKYSDDVLIALCIVDDDGNQRISTDDALTGIFDAWDIADCQRLLRAAIELCFPDVVKSDSLEAALKNSKPTNGSGSNGGSPCNSESRETNSTSDLTLTT